MRVCVCCDAGIGIDIDSAATACERTSCALNCTLGAFAYVCMGESERVRVPD